MRTINLSRAQVHVCTDARELSRSVAERVVQLAQEAIESRGRFTIAFSGGNTPKPMYELLATPEFSKRIDWSKTYAFWGDERCVPHDSPQSNYRMVNDLLLSKVPIPRENVHPTVGQDEDPSRSAENYERSIRNVFQANGKEIPSFDLNLMGIGDEGHTASIFPDSPVFDVQDRLVTFVHVEKVKMWRITFTLPLLNHARHVVFMVEGKGKQDILPQVLDSANPSRTIPAQFIHPVNGTLEWFVDELAAQKLPALAL